MTALPTGGLVAIGRQNLWEETLERLLGSRSNGTDVVVTSSYPIMSPWFPIIASVFDSKTAMQQSRVGATSIWSIFDLRLKNAFLEPNCYKVEREIDVE